MGRKTTSRTEEDSFVVERLFGDHHYKTTISNGKDTVEARGRTSEESQSRAGAKWTEKKGK